MTTVRPPYLSRTGWCGAALRVAALAALAGCNTVPNTAPTAAAPASAPTQAAAPATAPAPGPATSFAGARPGPGGGNVAGSARTFSTQMATYTSVGFDAVPGWVRDNFSESWPAFIGSCRVLTGRGAEWKQICDRARAVDGKDNTAIRGFFEREFAAYQIRDDDRKPDGVVTGYFEPEINGSRGYAPPYIYPVYGQPEDMLFLDVRKIAPAQRTGTVAATVDGRNVVIQTGVTIRDMGRAGLFALDVSALTLDALDKKVRLRSEGRRLLPYYSREEIETRGAPNAKVLAFVDNATALYEMQIQGSGRIRLPDGEVVRVAYAEQNGWPFRPTLAQAPGGGNASRIRNRGMGGIGGGGIELDLDDDSDESALDGPNVIRTRGFKLSVPAVIGTVAVPGRRTSAPAAGSGIKDPSYVFFREATGGTSGGPVGALGVPLSAGRSIAVDPRATPLGYPVFVSTRSPDTGSPMQRLTIAQDTGGAIRGAVRADYFFGNGTQAANSARRMKERGQLWILLPRGLQVAAASALSLIRTRGVGGSGAGGAGLPECLVPVEGQCVDD